MSQSKEESINFAIEIRGVDDPPLEWTRSEKLKHMEGNKPLKRKVAEHLLGLDPEALVASVETIFPMFIATIRPSVAKRLLEHPQVTAVNPAGSFELANQGESS